MSTYNAEEKASNRLTYNAKTNTFYIQFPTGDSGRVEILTQFSALPTVEILNPDPRFRSPSLSAYGIFRIPGDCTKRIGSMKLDSADCSLTEPSSHSWSLP